MTNYSWHSSESVICLNQVYCFGGTRSCILRKETTCHWCMSIDCKLSLTNKYLVRIVFFPSSEHSSPRSTRKHYPTILPSSNFFHVHTRHLVYVGWTSMFITKDCFHFQGFFKTFRCAKILVSQWVKG